MAIETDIDKVLNNDQKIKLNPKIKEIMTVKVLHCKPDNNLKEVFEVMTTENIKRIPVVNNDYDLVGMVTDRDVRLACKNGFDYTLDEILKSLSEIKVGDMLPPKEACQYIDEDQSVLDAAKVMRMFNISGLPVVDKDSRLSGVITRSDILDQAIRILDPIKK
ncbi:hypothetical protein DLAC_09409 [Tieghemostelium lacteum]|uniref:CBS domain-containing protein n=1 Tax=Tieghemostelium lacteum TaxID=361077 RepID=A0A151Z9Z6_TIELA|nr:hypothetical protein DLAC_09409 [Tieghemostelium lacteum]|eukprot:KYQ90770.1 hypothetical protein DLAC_09409 [Tieghemostelium lacteum]